jgi:hypothetical protein
MTVQDVIAALLIGMIVGVLCGVLAWDFWYAEPRNRRQQRRIWRLEDSVRSWQRLYLAAEGSHAAPAEVEGNEHWSTKAPTLTRVR